MVKKASLIHIIKHSFYDDRTSFFVQEADFVQAEKVNMKSRQNIPVYRVCLFHFKFNVALTN